MKLKLDDGKKLSIKLEKDHYGNVDVIVKKVDGGEIICGVLLTIQKDGTFCRLENVDDETGLQLDADNRIVEGN